MKTFLTAAVLALSLAASAYAQGDRSFKVPQDDNRNLASDLTFVGVRVASSVSVGNSDLDTSKLWYAGEGVLYGVEVSTGETTAYVVCIDTGATPSHLDQDPKGLKLMAPCFLQATNSQQCGTGTTGSGHQDIPRHFTRGLFCVNRGYTGNNGNFYIPLFRKARE